MTAAPSEEPRKPGPCSPAPGSGPAADPFGFLAGGQELTAEQAARLARLDDGPDVPATDDPACLEDPDCGAPDWWLALPSAEQARQIAEDFEPRPVPEAIAAGFTHRQGGNGTGFEAGGELDMMLPGAELGAHVGRVRRDPRVLSDGALIGALSANRRQLSWHQATEYELIAELDRRRARPDGAEGEHVDAELAAALTETPRLAQTLLEYSRQLERLEPTRALLAAGIIDTRRAQSIARHLEPLSDEHAAAVQDVILPRVADMNTGRLGEALQTAIKRVDPEAARKRKEKAQQDARVECWAEDAGTAALAGRDLSPAQTIAADKKIRACAQWLKEHGTVGTLEQISAKVFLALLNGQPLHTLLPSPASQDPAAPAGTSTAPAGTCAAPAGTWAASPPGPAADLTGTVHLTMPVSAWSGQSDAPGQISGYGVADASTCRDVAGQLATSPRTSWCITLIDPQGRAVGHGCARAGPGPPGSKDPRSWLATVTIHPIETGTCAHRREAAGYRIPGSLRHVIKIRSPRCGFPGCRRPALRCDDDHTIAFHLGGRSCECNLYPLCRRHHRCKQAPGWHLRQPEPGHLIWTAPSGRTYATTAEPYPV